MLSGLTLGCESLVWVRTNRRTSSAAGSSLSLYPAGSLDLTEVHLHFSIRRENDSAMYSILNIVGGVVLDLHLKPHMRSKCKGVYI